MLLAMNRLLFAKRK